LTTVSDPPQQAEPPGAPPLGEKTASFVLALLQDFYRQEFLAE
jgi:hypothetical protein